eukprot:364624-Chlamydomonas_euryale.AAC.5
MPRAHSSSSTTPRPRARWWSAQRRAASSLRTASGTSSTRSLWSEGLKVGRDVAECMGTRPHTLCKVGK